MDNADSKYDIPYEKHNDDHAFCRHNRVGKRENKWRALFYCIFMIFCISTCIVTCVSAIYCGRSLMEIQKLKQDMLELQKDAGTRNIAAEYGRNDKLRSPEEEDDENGSTDDEYSIDEDLEESTADEDSIDKDDLEESSDDESYDLEASSVGSGDNEDLLQRRSRSAGEKSRKQKGKGGKKRRGSGKSNKFRFVRAAQFSGSITDEAVRKALPDQGYNMYDIRGEGQALHIFEAADWVSDTVSPVTATSAVFTVKYPGVYLVYAQVLFSGNQSLKSASIVKKSKNEWQQALSCNTGVHPTLHNEPNQQEQSCTIIGMLHLKKGDTLEVQSNNIAARIELDAGTTYFGIVQLNNK